jgi:hypothetical protein
VVAPREINARKLWKIAIFARGESLQTLSNPYAVTHILKGAPDLVFESSGEEIEEMPKKEEAGIGLLSCCSNLLLQEKNASVYFQLTPDT